MSSHQPESDGEQLRHLADKMIGGEATGDEVRQLESMLEGNHALQREYLRYALVYAQLRLTSPALRYDHCTNAALARVCEGPASDRRGRWTTLKKISSVTVAIAATVFLCLAIVHEEAKPVAGPAFPKHGIEPVMARYDNRKLPIDTVATLSLKAADRPEVGVDHTRYISPTTFRIDGGATEFASAGGAEVRVEGPAMFGVASSTGGMLYDGSVHARLSRPESTFSVLTSNLRFVDLGTEFRVTVVNSQCVKLHVLDGEVEVQSRARLPLHYWNFDELREAGSLDATLGGTRWSRGATANRVEGIVGSGAIQFENKPSSYVRIEGGTGENVCTGSMACSGGVTLEAMIISKWTAKRPENKDGAYDEIFRKEDGIYRMLLSFQNDDWKYDVPDVAPGPCLSFGLHLEQHGYSELDMPLDGKDGRPSLAELTDGRPHHVVATYDSFTGKKAIYIDGELCFEHDFPIGTLILSGGPEPAHIGNLAAKREPFHGVIDEVAFYDFALTPEEVATHYQNASSGKNYFGTSAEQLQDVYWQAVTRVKEGQVRHFDPVTGLPLDSI